MLELHHYFPAILLDLTWELESQLRSSVPTTDTTR